MTAEAYIQMLDNVMTVDIHPDICFQQDGATTHTSLHAMDWLRNRFGNNIISHRFDFQWPARSSDLSPLDYFLWGYVKQGVLKAKQNTINALQKVI